MSTSLPIGIVLWKGKSRIDGTPIMVILTGLRGKSTVNAKTGDMLQTWILRQDMLPTDAVKEGLDDAICGTCPLRGDHGQDRACYVNIAHPNSIWRAWKRGGWPNGPYLETSGPRLVREIRDAVRDRGVRFGSYGDPAAAPYQLWATLADAAAFHTGYTRRWLDLGTVDEERWQQLVMASAHTPREAHRALVRGWRPFRVRFRTEPLLENEYVCPASNEAKTKVQCVDCRLCDGRRLGDTRRTPVIIAHGVAPNIAGYRRMRSGAAQRSLPLLGKENE